jgi:hypothetical protein
VCKCVLPPGDNPVALNKYIKNILHRNCLIKYVIEGKMQGRIKVTEVEEEDVSGYWMILVRREGTGN